MKCNTPYTCMMILLFLLLCMTAECATRVVRIRTRASEDICGTLQQIFGDRMRFVSVPSINAVVIGADTDSDVNEAALLLAQLDRRPATFRFSIRRRERRSDSSRELGTPRHRGDGFRYESSSSRNRLSEARVITGMEGTWHLLADDMIRVETLHTPWGPESAVIRHRQGVEIKGVRGSASGTAILDVRASSGPESRTSSLLSQIEAPFGQWIALGGTTRSDSDSGSQSAVGGRSGYSNRKGAGTALDEWEICVDLLDPGE